MEITNILIQIAILIIAYLIGSINNALIISKLVFRKDVRDYGSKNAGGTNTGRVFGKKAGLTVMALDISKSIVVYWSIILLFKFVSFSPSINQNFILHLAMIMVALGHCYPVYYKFKGGKAVSIISGYILATNVVLTIIGITIFFITLKLSKVVSLSSIVMSVLTPLISLLLLINPLNTFGFWPNAVTSLVYFLPTFFLIALIVILKHSANIKRLLKGEENKIKWMR